ncbi:MAG: lipoate--protein ligase [Clostridia bacterium]|nr:lipoate--protein ligase [Clostridia bacterium]
MITIFTNSTDPYFNLAAEEYFLYNSTEDIFMLWQNDKAAIIGKNQNVYAEINTEYARKNNITIVRRITGGGAVYHDLGNVNYTFITSREKAGTLNFEYFTSPVISALKEHNINSELSGRNDILCDGAKVSGNAQFSTDTRVLHHGTLLFDSDLSVMPHLLTVAPEKIRSKSIKSVRSRVTNIKPLFADSNITVQNFMDIVCDYVTRMYNAKKHGITEEERNLINEIRGKYVTHSWTFPAKYTYDCCTRKYGAYGLVEVNYSVKQGVIKQISFFGDFFGTRDICEMESLLCGVHHNETEVQKAIENIEINEYISKMTKSEFIKLLFE